jgi:Alginate lyase
MRFVLRPFSSSFRVLLMVSVAAGCSGGASGHRPSIPPPSGGGGSDATGGTAGSVTGGSGGASGKGGSSGSGGMSGGSGGSAPTPDAATGGAGAGGAKADGSTGTAADARSYPDSSTPMSTDGGPKPSYEGEIPIYYGPDPGPVVEMNCPGDPTEGWTEYKDSFNVQRPYNVPINTRFSITNGIYNFWVFPPDAPHSPTANGRNPRTEARYGGTADSATGKNFTTGMRMYNADMLIERNAVGSAIMQIHTTADGGGPIGVRIGTDGNMVNNGSLTVVEGSSVPGGLIDKWFNYKASLDTSTLEVKIYINNCLKSTYKGPRGDGNFYFKNGVYFCKTSTNGCFSHYKNIHLYKK